MDFVIDASVGVSWVIPSQASEAANVLLDRIIAGARFVVPSLWPFEVGNSLLVLMRRKKIDQARCARARMAIEQLNPVVDDEGHRALGAVWQLAEQHSLSIYDAAYLELSRRRGLALATRDASLRRAALKCGVENLL